jgi:hypothetical protein
MRTGTLYQLRYAPTFKLFAADVYGRNIGISKFGMAPVDSYADIVPVSTLPTPSSSLLQMSMVGILASPSLVWHR